MKRILLFTASLLLSTLIFGQQIFVADTFHFTGGPQVFVVPLGCQSVHVEAYGASGAPANPDPTHYINQSRFPGKGAKVLTNIPVTQGDSMHIYVGGQGGFADEYDVDEIVQVLFWNVDFYSGGQGGWNGGGNGASANRPGHGGGGASDIRIGGTSLNDRIVVAGGGGGLSHHDLTASNTTAGHGGWIGGAPSGFSSGPFLYANSDNYYSISNSSGGTQALVGLGACSYNRDFDSTCFCNVYTSPLCASDGSLGFGGDGATMVNYFYLSPTGGGGGGGGYYGGGGGKDRASGAGGSSYIDSSININSYCFSGVNYGNGYIILSYYYTPVYGCTDSNYMNYNPLANTDDGSCNSLVNCPGYNPIDTVYCYGDNETTIFNYTSVVSGSPITINFVQGYLEEIYDEIHVYDGLNASGPILSNFNLTGDVSSYSYQSTGNYLSVYLDSDNINSCQTENYTPLQFEIQCGEIVVYGCTDTLACNYSDTANVDDASCIYPTNSSVSVFSCDSYSWNGMLYDSTGIYTYTTTNSAGCDSTAYLDLSIDYSQTTNVNLSICDGDSIVIGTSVYLMAASYIDTLVGVNNCDSIVLLNLIIKSHSSGVNNQSICIGDSVVVGNSVYYTPGTYTDVLVSANSCDSIVTTTVSMIPAGCMDSIALNYDSTKTCDDGSCCYTNLITVTMYDNHGDSWVDPWGNIDTYSFIDSTGSTLASGYLSNPSLGTDVICLPTGCYDVVLDGPSAFENAISINGGGLIIQGTHHNISIGGVDCSPVACFDTTTSVYSSNAMVSKTCINYICDENIALLKKYDSYGDGWNDAIYTITNNNGDTIISGGFTGNYINGFDQTDTLCLSNGCYNITVGGGWLDSEITFDFGNLVGATAGTYSNICFIRGCTDPLATNYDPTATVDDGSCQYPSTCTNPSPTGAYVSELIHDRARINWDNMNSSTCMVDQYRIRYREQGTSSWSSKTMAGSGLCIFGLNTTSKKILGLSPSTSYEYYMKAWYCGGGVSSWSAIQTFTTADACPNVINFAASSPTTTKATFTWDSTAAYSFVRIKLRVDTTGAAWATAGGFGVFYPTLTKNKNGLTPGQPYRASARTWCDPSGGTYRSAGWTSPIFWTQPTSIRVEGGTAINNLDVYPNPSRDIFNVSFTSEDVQDLEVRVINVVGEVVYTENLEEFVGEYTKSIDLATYTKGVYFLEIKTEEGVVYKKLALQ